MTDNYKVPSQSKSEVIFFKYFEQIEFKGHQSFSQTSNKVFLYIFFKIFFLKKIIQGYSRKLFHKQKKNKYRHHNNNNNNNQLNIYIPLNK